MGIQNWRRIEMEALLQVDRVGAAQREVLSIGSCVRQLGICFVADDGRKMEHSDGRK